MLSSYEKNGRRWRKGWIASFGMRRLALIAIGIGHPRRQPKSLRRRLYLARVASLASKVSITKAANCRGNLRFAKTPTLTSIGQRARCPDSVHSTTRSDGPPTSQLLRRDLTCLRSGPTTGVDFGSTTRRSWMLGPSTVRPNTKPLTCHSRQVRSTEFEWNTSKPRVVPPRV